MDIIFIETLKTEAIIGIYEWERQHTQPLIFDIEMKVGIARAAKSDEINDTVDYKQVADDVIEQVESTQFELLESLCEHLCQRILQQHTLVEEIKLKVKKPQAVPQADAVGLCITRSR